MESTLACVEGAIQMYKNSPPELKAGVLGALRAALLFAANTCQQVMGGTIDQTSYAPPPVKMDEPDEEPVAAAAAPTQASTPPTMGNDTNTVYLKKVYEALENASGDGKLGLGPIGASEVRTNTNPSTHTPFKVPLHSPVSLLRQASELADLVVGMRGMLLEELDSGIPVALNSEESASASSTYQQMLAKARAKKSQA